MHEKEIPTDQAWRLIDGWHHSRAQVGLLFFGPRVTFCTTGRVTSVRDGKVRLEGSAAGTAVNLRGATFLYGPMQTWPRWPAGPIVEVTALQACLESGEWVIFGEGFGTSIDSYTGWMKRIR
jgi:hypothetical protein